MELQKGLSRISSVNASPVCATILYAPFKQTPFGHLSIAFQFGTGDEIVISPEARIKKGEEFSMLRGLLKNYHLHYVIYDKQALLASYKNEGRKVEERPLNLSGTSLNLLYERMLSRSQELEAKIEWYHTLLNSCTTNILRHVDESRMYRRSIARRCWVIAFPASITA